MEPLARCKRVIFESSYPAGQPRNHGGGIQGVNGVCECPRLQKAFVEGPEESLQVAEAGYWYRDRTPKKSGGIYPPQNPRSVWLVLLVKLERCSAQIIITNGELLVSRAGLVERTSCSQIGFTRIGCT